MQHQECQLPLKTKEKEEEDSLSEEARQRCNKIFMDDPVITEKQSWLKTLWICLLIPLNWEEAVRPEKDQVCYRMLKPDCNRVWDLLLPSSTVKASNSYTHSEARKVLFDPFVDTLPKSWMYQMVERTVTGRLTYLLEGIDLSFSTQSGFRRGWNTMDSVPRFRNQESTM